MSTCTLQEIDDGPALAEHVLDCARIYNYERPRETPRLGASLRPLHSGAVLSATGATQPSVRSHVRKAGQERRAWGRVVECKCQWGNLRCRPLNSLTSYQLPHT